MGEGDALTLDLGNQTFPDQACVVNLRMSFGTISDFSALWSVDDPACTSEVKTVGLVQQVVASAPLLITLQVSTLHDDIVHHVSKQSIAQTLIISRKGNSDTVHHTSWASFSTMDYVIKRILSVHFDCLAPCASTTRVQKNRPVSVSIDMKGPRDSTRSACICRIAC
jgi:hypothetical protein